MTERAGLAGCVPERIGGCVPERIGRHAAQITAGNMASRLTGLVRVVAVAGALGTTFLGNTYQTANLVSNIAFELLAAGLLSSVLVPPFVRLVDAGSHEEADEVAGALLGLALSALGIVTVAGLVGRTWIMRGLTVAVPDPAVRAAEVRLGSFLLVVFLPQVLLYAVGAIATARLQGARRFVAPAFAPVANNVVVVATMAVFWILHGSGGGGVGLDLATSERLVLAVGTTAGVAAMTLVTVVGARRAGFRLRPRWAYAVPWTRPARPARPAHVRAALAELRQAGLWGAAYLAFNQALVATTLVLANRVAGGVVAYQIAFTVFLLPFAVGAHPTLTAVYPRLVAEAGGRRWKAFADALATSGGTIVFLVVPATALLVAVGRPALSVVRFGHLDVAGVGLTARVLAAYAFGILGYAGLQLLTRASYALGDTRTPALVYAGVAGGGSLLMALAFAAASGDDRVVVLGLAHSAAMMAGAAMLVVFVRRRAGEPCLPAASLARALPCAVAAGVAARLVSDRIGVGGRIGAALAVTSSSAVAGAVYLGGQWGLRAPELRRLWPRHLAVAATSDRSP
ncbi:MAG: murein biosynthesis integral membrane protein MurJ [Acidimicrobiales bacterium]